MFGKKGRELADLKRRLTMGIEAPEILSRKRRNMTMNSSSYRKLLAVATFTMLILLGFTKTIPAQQPPGKILKRDIPQTTTEPGQTRAVMTDKMLGNIKIARLTIQQPQSQCVGEWHATIVNPNNADLSFPVEAYQFDGHSGQWHQIGVAQSVQLKKNEEKSIQGNWERRQHAQKLKLSVKRNQTVYREKEVTLPALPAPNVEITKIDVTDTGYSMHIMNKDAAAQCFLGRQCYKLATETGPTSGGLGGGPIKLPGSSTIVSNNAQSAGWKTGVNYIKCDIRNFMTNTTVTTKTVSVSQ
jgi:hypothetical protein